MGRALGVGHHGRRGAADPPRDRAGLGVRRMDRGGAGRAARPGPRDLRGARALARHHHHGRGRDRRLVDRGGHRHGRCVADHLGHRRRLRAVTGTRSPTRGRGRRPRGRRHRVRPARRPAVPGAALGDRRRLGADDAALGLVGRPPAPRVDPSAALHDAGQPARHPARHHRPGARLPLVRPRAGPPARREPPGRRRDHRGAGQRRPRPARRRRGVGVQHLHRRRRTLVPDHEQGQARPQRPRETAYVRWVPHRPAGVHARLRADDRGDRQGALPGPSSGTTRPDAAGRSRLDVRRAPGRDQRAGPRPQHRDHHRGDAQGHPLHLRRLRRLRRDRPPRRDLPSRVAGGPRRPRPGAGHARAARRVRRRGATTS